MIFIQKYTLHSKILWFVPNFVILKLLKIVCLTLNSYLTILHFIKEYVGFLIIVCYLADNPINFYYLINVGIDNDFK